LQLFKGCIVSPSALMDIVDAVQEAPARNKLTAAFVRRWG
jgi:hypothetical protein